MTTNDSSPHDPAGYFSPDYFTARTRFRKAVEKSAGKLTALELDSKGPGGEKLTIDVGWFGPERPRRVLLHSSGMHGVEAFCGSAIQLQLLDNLPNIPDGTALVLVHVLNPYGMAWLRRYNENNVDLNRNYLEPGKHTGGPEDYVQVDTFLNPKSPPSPDFFLLRAAWRIFTFKFPNPKAGYAALKQIIAGGQYEFPKGLMFGGQRLEQGPALYQSFVAERLSTAETIHAIDVHTGLGKSGEDTLLVKEEDQPTIRRMFGDRVTPLNPEKGLAYLASGSMDGMFPRVLPHARTYFVVQEFGTVNPIQVLSALRQENRWHHYGKGTPDHPAKLRLKEAFNPDDDIWRRRVLVRGKELLDQAIGFGTA